MPTVQACAAGFHNRGVGALVCTRVRVTPSSTPVSCDYFPPLRIAPSFLPFPPDAFPVSLRTSVLSICFPLDNAGEMYMYIPFVLTLTHITMYTHILYVYILYVHNVPLVRQLLAFSFAHLNPRSTPN